MGSHRLCNRLSRLVSTFFFIQKAVDHIPAVLLGLLRFLMAGLILLLWCALNGDRIRDAKQITPAIVTGVLLLFLGNGAVIWAEKSLPSSFAAVLVSSVLLWSILLDRRKWKNNFTSRETLIGLIIGFTGVILLFANEMSAALSSAGNHQQILGLVILVMGCISWSAGSIYSKYKSTDPPQSIPRGKCWPADWRFCPRA